MKFNILIYNVNFDKNNVTKYNQLPVIKVTIRYMQDPSYLSGNMKQELTDFWGVLSAITIRCKYLMKALRNLLKSEPVFFDFP